MINNDDKFDLAIIWYKDNSKKSLIKKKIYLEDIIKLIIQEDITSIYIEKDVKNIE